MDAVEQKLDFIIRELAQLKEEVRLGRADSQKFAINLDKQIKDAIKSSSFDIMSHVSKEKKAV